MKRPTLENYGVDSNDENWGTAYSIGLENGKFGIPKRHEYLLRCMIFDGEKPIYLGDCVKAIEKELYMDDSRSIMWSPLPKWEGKVVAMDFDLGPTGYQVETGAIIRTVRIVGDNETVIGEEKEGFYRYSSQLEIVEQTPENQRLEKILRKSLRES